MAPSTCPTCNVLLHARLRARISLLASLRSRSQVRRYTITPEPAVLAHHWDTIPPTSAQLKSATTFIQTHPPRKLWTANEWRKQNESDANFSGTQLIPEVTFLGRSNVGKSSVLNALLQSPNLNRVGPRPGKTTVMHAWALSASDPVTGGAGPGGEMDTRLAILDMPGYGHGSRVDWGNEIVTYLTRRKQLRRAFVLIDGLHGIKKGDWQMIELLRKQRISYQIVVSKVDRVLEREKKGGNASLQALFAQIREQLVQRAGAGGVAGLGEILAVGGLKDRVKDKIKERDMLGIEQLRWAVLVAVGLENWATKRSSTTVGKEKRTGNTKDVSHPVSAELKISAQDYPSDLSRLVDASSMGRPTRTDSTSYSTTFSTPNSEEKRQTKHNPSSSPSPNTRPSITYNPVGGLAELEAVSSLRNPKPSASRRTRSRGSKNRNSRGGDPSSSTSQNEHIPELEQKYRKTSELLTNRQGLKNQKRNAVGKKTAGERTKRGRIMREIRTSIPSSSTASPPSITGGDRGSSFPSSLSSSTRPPPPYSTEDRRPPPPSPDLASGGKGVGGMADLLAMSARPGKGTARGRASAAAERERGGPKWAGRGKREVRWCDGG